MSFLASDPGVVLFHYAVVVLVVLGAGAAYRFRSPSALVITTVMLGVGTSLFTLAPISRPYDLVAENPRSPSSAKDSVALLELAEISSGAASGRPSSSFVSGLGNPRPLWSVLSRIVSAGRPERAIRLNRLLAVVLPGALALVVFTSLRSVDKENAWHWAAASFIAVLASSPPLDAFRLFGPLFESFFLEAPHRGACLLLGAMVWSASWSRPRVMTLAAAVLCLVAIAWIDFWIFAWLALGLAVFQLVKGRLPGRRSAGIWILLSLSALVATSRLALLPIGGPTARMPSSSEVIAFRMSFLDPLTVSADLQWVFVVAAASAVWVWRDTGAVARGLVSVVLGSYGLFVAAAIVYQTHPLAEPSVFFHLVRFSVGLLAGAGGVVLVARALERVPWTQSRSTSDRHAMAACLVVALFLPVSFPFYWTPIKMDPLYYECLRPVEPDTVALGKWMSSNTNANAAVLATTETSEYLSALSGQSIVYGARLLPREEAARRRRSIRSLLRAETDGEMRAALDDLGVTAIVWEPEFQWEYGQAPLARWEASRIFTVSRPAGEDFVVFVRADAR